MRALPDAFAGYAESLREGVRRGRVAAVRQVDKCAEQCDTYSGAGDGEGYFTAIASASERTGTLADELAAAAQIADAAYADLATFLRSELRQHAPEKDAVGREVYSLASRDFLGATVDLEETYHWGWKEFLGLEAELKEVCARIRPGATPREVSDQLDDDARYQVTGTDGLQRWMQQLSDDAVDELSRTHFDVPEPIRRLDCKIAPPGGNGRRLLHGTERRPVTTGSDVVVGRARPRGVLDVAGDHGRLPRGRSRPSPADRHGGVPA